MLKDCDLVHTHGIFTFPGSELMLRYLRVKLSPWFPIIKTIAIFHFLTPFLKNIIQYLLLACFLWRIVFVFAFEGTTLSSLWIFFCNLSYSLDSYLLSSGGLCIPLLVHICMFFVLHLLSNHKSNRCQCFSTKYRDKKENLQRTCFIC